MPRPATQIISRQGTALAALEIIDEQGLEKFGLSLVAARLGVKTPSLYHHFQGKSEVLAAVARLLLEEGELPEAVAGLDWREEVVRISLASWHSILRHSKAAPLLLRFFPRVLLLGAYEHWARLFTANGVPVEWQMTILEGSEKLTFGSALFVSAGQSNEIYETLKLTPNDNPYFTAAIAAHTMSEEETFVECLRSFLRGLPIDHSRQSEN